MWGLIGSGIILRILSLKGDLWLDEIWSLNLVAGATSIPDLLTLAHDNNHLLNSFFLYFLGPGQQDYIYRIPALCFGAGALLISPWVTKDLPLLKRLIVTLFLILSYPLVLYSSEARGYAPLIFCCLAGFGLLRSYLKTSDSNVLVLFWVISVIGILGHLTFLHFYVAAFIWSLHVLSRRFPFTGLCREMTFLFLPSLVFYIFLYFIFGQYLPEGTGPLLSYIQIMINAASIGWGGGLLSIDDPGGMMIALLIAGSVALICALEMFILARERNDLWLFYVSAIFVVPAFFLLIYEPRVIFERYFLTSLLFSYFVLASFLERLYRQGSIGKGLIVVGLGLFIFGTSAQLDKLFKFGRGSYRAAIHSMINPSLGTANSVSAENDFRAKLVLEYYRNEVLKNNFLEYSSDTSDTPDSAWHIVQSQDPGFIPGNNIGFGRVGYELKGQFLATALSGESWYIYKKLS